MPPKIKFKQKEIINLAFDIIMNEGLSNLSARIIAKKLQSSTSPIYTTFNSMEYLIECALEKAKDIMLDYCTRQYSSNYFLNLGVGLVAFSKDYKNLYNAIFLDKRSFIEFLDDFLKKINESIISSPEKIKKSIPKSLSSEIRLELLHEMWIFTHGLASLVCNGYIEDIAEDKIITKLEKVAVSIVKAKVLELAQSIKENDASSIAEWGKLNIKSI